MTRLQALHTENKELAEQVAKLTAEKEELSAQISEVTIHLHNLLPHNLETA